MIIKTIQEGKMKQMKGKMMNRLIQVKAILVEKSGESFVDTAIIS